MTAKRRDRKFLSVLITLLIAVMIVAESAGASFAAVNKDVKKPSIDAASAMVYCLNTGEVLYSKNANKRVEPWSTTKLLTALLVVENMDMDQTVTVSKKAASLGGSTMNLVVGEKCTVRQLLYGTLMLSGNDAAYALGQACGNGDIKVFVKMMNDRAKKLGCTGSHFANPNGLQNKNHYTTASDFMKIAIAALSNKTVRKIAGTTRYHMQATNKSKARDMETHLDLLETKGSGVVAGKTGYWEEDDSSVALEYDKNGLRLILVQFKTDLNDREDEDKALINFAKKAIVTLKATDTNESAGEVRVQFGAKTSVKAYPKSVVPAYPKNGKQSEITTKAKMNSHVKAPLKSGDTVGTLTVYCDGKKAGTTKLVVHENIKKGWFLSRFYISNNATIVIGIVLIVAILLYMAVLRPRHLSRGKKEKDSLFPYHPRH